MSACLAEHNTQPFVSQPAIWSLQGLGRLGFPLVSAGSSLQWVSQQYWDYCSGSVACLWPARLRLWSSVLWKWKQCPPHGACLALGPGRHPEIREQLSEVVFDLITEWLWSSCPCSWGHFLLLPYRTEDQTWQWWSTKTCVVEWKRSRNLPSPLEHRSFALPKLCISSPRFLLNIIVFMN